MQPEDPHHRLPGQCRPTELEEAALSLPGRDALCMPAPAQSYKPQDSPGEAQAPGQQRVAGSKRPWPQHEVSLSSRGQVGNGRQAGLGLGPCCSAVHCQPEEFLPCAESTGLL